MEIPTDSFAALTGRLEDLEQRTAWLAGQLQRAEQGRFATDREVEGIAVRLGAVPGAARSRGGRSRPRHLRVLGDGAP
jgi:hypothetical protein